MAAKIISVEALNDEKKLIEDLSKDVVSKNKGTGQLIYNCNRILRRDCFWDNGMPKDFAIYPLLVMDDISFSASGFNSYIVEFTKEYVEQHIGTVLPFTALDLDTFILISELIRDGQLNIFQVIENYHSYINNATFEIKEMSLASYIRENFEIQSPQIVSEWLNTL